MGPETQFLTVGAVDRLPGSVVYITADRYQKEILASVAGVNMTRGIWSVVHVD